MDGNSARYFSVTINMILVTGGSGYVGSVLVRRLLEKGHHVRVLDAGYFGHEALDEVRDKIELVEGDIRKATPDVFRDVKGVVHLAGFSNDPTAEYRPKENFSVNVDGTKHLVSLTKEAGVSKFIFGSSCSVYYTTNPEDAIEKNEDHFITPTVPYSLSKHMAEDAVLEAEKAGVKPVIFRKGTVYGLSPRMRYDLVVNTLLRDSFLNGKMVIHQGGRMWRPLVDVKNVADAYCYALENDLSRIYNLIDINILVSDLADAIQSQLKEEFGVAVDIEKQDVGVSRSYRVSGERLKNHGFRGSRSLREAVSEMWQDLQTSKRDLDHHKYYNIRSFETIFS